MFDRTPDATLVADLIAAQSAPALMSADTAAADLVEQAMAWERLAGWVESQRLETLHRFEVARIAADTAFGDEPEVSLAQRPASERASIARLRQSLQTEAGKFAAEEIALALNISPTSAHKQLHLARDLHEVHRDVREALELGQISPFVASMIVQATRKLPDPARRLLDEAVTADAVEQPAGRAIAAARARVSEADEDADKAAQRAALDRRLFLKPMDDGQAMLGAVLSADDAVRAFTRCDTAARAHQHAGASNTLDQLRCDAFTAIMLGGSPDPASKPGSASASAPIGTPAAPSSVRPDQVEPPRPVSVSAVIALTTLLSLDSKSAWLDGYGTIAAGVAQHIVSSGDATLSRLLCDPVTGATVVADPTRYKPTAALAHAIGCRDRRCRMPTCEARVRHLDHIQAKVDAGLTTDDNVHGLCERSHLAKHHPGWRVAGDARSVVTWQTPTGRAYPSLPPQAAGYGSGPPEALDNPLDIPAWLSWQQRLRAEIAARDADQHAA